MLQLKIGTKITQIENNLNQQNFLELTTLIAQEKNIQKLATLHTNRGALSYQSGKNQSALLDMQKALEYNYLNYAAYYNIFTIKACEGNFVEGLKNLCCALSCLYLIRGKRYNSQSDINKCVKLAENNCEGRLMKALYYQKKNKHNLALNQIKWILETEPHNLEIIQLKNYIESLVQSTNTRYDRESDQEQEQINSSMEAKNKDKKGSLKCTMYDDLSTNEDFSCESQINQKLEEFNQIFKDVIGGLINLTGDAVDKRVFFVNQDGTQEPLLFEAEVKQQQLKNFALQEEELNVNTSQPRNQQKNLVAALAGSQDLYTAKSNSSDPQRGELERAGSTDSYYVPSSASQSSGLAQSGLETYLLRKQSNEKSIPENSSYDACGSFTVIKAKDDNKEISIKVENIQLIEMDEQEKYNNMYCLFQYGQNKITLINSTGWPERKIDAAGEEQGKKLVVKLYNKEILAFNDRLLGQGTQEVRQSGIYMITLFSNKFKGSIIGKVMLNIKTT